MLNDIKIQYSKYVEGIKSNVYGKNLSYEIHVLEKKNITGLMTELKEVENKIVLSDGWNTETIKSKNL